MNVSSITLFTQKIHQPVSYMCHCLFKVIFWVLLNDWCEFSIFSCASVKRGCFMIGMQFYLMNRILFIGLTIFDLNCDHWWLWYVSRFSNQVCIRPSLVSHRIIVILALFEVSDNNSWKCMIYYGCIVITHLECQYFFGVGERKVVTTGSKSLSPA